MEWVDQCAAVPGPTALGLDTHRKELLGLAPAGINRVGLQMEPRKLGASPTACQAAKADAAAGPSGLAPSRVCAGSSLGAPFPAREMEHLGHPRVPHLVG